MAGKRGDKPLLFFLNKKPVNIPVERDYSKGFVLLNSCQGTKNGVCP